jgi:hypothetical protein
LHASVGGTEEKSILGAPLGTKTPMGLRDNESTI